MPAAVPAPSTSQPALGRSTAMPVSRVAARCGDAWRWVLALLLVSASAAALAQDPEAALSEIETAFASLRLAAYFATLVGGCVGLYVFVYRRRKLMRHARLYGALVSVGAALLIFIGLDLALAPPSARQCASDLLLSRQEARPYDLACRDAREHLANAYGLATGYRVISGMEREGDLVPIDAPTTRAVGFVSVALAALLLFLVLSWLLRRVFVRS